VDSRDGLDAMEEKITKSKDLIQSNKAKVLKNHITDYLLLCRSGIAITGQDMTQHTHYNRHAATSVF
jgi:hypothetical protein